MENKQAINSLLMRVISRPPLIEFGKRHPPAVIPLSSWLKKISQATCNNLHELKVLFSTCDYIGNDRYVFNIGGNHYRLVVVAHFKRQAIYIRGVLTHAEYDAYNKKGTLADL